MRAVPRLCIKLCPGIHLTTEENHGKTRYATKHQNTWKTNAQLPYAPIRRIYRGGRRHHADMSVVILKTLSCRPRVLPGHKYYMKYQYRLISPPAPTPILSVRVRPPVQRVQTSPGYKAPQPRCPSQSFTPAKRSVDATFFLPPQCCVLLDYNTLQSGGWYRHFGDTHCLHLVYFCILFSI